MKLLLFCHHHINHLMPYSWLFARESIKCLFFYFISSLKRRCEHMKMCIIGWLCITRTSRCLFYISKWYAFSLLYDSYFRACVLDSGAHHNPHLCCVCDAELCRCGYGFRFMVDGALLFVNMSDI